MISRQIVLVLGMHRSGTSALAALISRLGFDLGKKLLPANEYNSLGYFESEKIVRFHSETLDRLGSSWHDMRFLSEDAFSGQWVDEAAQKLSSLVREEFGAASRIVIKDPRACRLLPIWLRFARECNLDLRFVLIGRHPLQVAYSLAHRDGFSRQKSLLLWLQYNLAAERETRTSQRLILRFQNLMSEPLKKVRELASFLGIEQEIDLAEVAASLDPSIARHVAETDTFSEQHELQEWTKKVWQFLFQRNPETASAKKHLDQISHDLRERLEIFPEEASGRGDYEAMTMKRTLSSLRELHETQREALQGVARQRDEAHRRAEAVEQEHRFLKERYRERDQLLQTVILHRDEARKQGQLAAAAISLIEGEFKILKERYQERIRTLRDVMLQRDEARKSAEASKQAAAGLETRIYELKREHEEAAANWAEVLGRFQTAAEENKQAEVKLRRDLQDALEGQTRLQARQTALRDDLATTEEQRYYLEQELQLTAQESARREAQQERMHAQLEKVRHAWTALLVRRTLKKLANSFLARAASLPRVNGITPTIWNQRRAGFRFGLSVLPDLDGPGRVCLEGWIVAEETNTPPAAVRLVNEAGIRRTGKRGRQRLDVALLFPNDDRAQQSGFAFADLEDLQGSRCRLEVRKSGGRWIALALVDFNGVGPQHLHDIHRIATSHLFDPAWYARRYKQTKLKPLSLIAHYLREGAVKGFFPNPLFDTAYYLKSNPEILTTGENPLLHYLWTWQQGKLRQPNRLFEPVWYLKQNKDVEHSGLNPLAHYLRHGKREKRNPGPHFDSASYLRANPDVERSPLDPLSHYLHYGLAEGREATAPGNAIRWIHEGDSDEGKTNILLVGHVLGEKVFGSERSLLELIQLIDRDRFNIFCSFPQPSGALLETIKPFLAGVAFFPYKWWRGDESSTDGFASQFEILMRERRIGLVHVNSIVLRDPLIAAKRLGIPSVLHLREIITFDPDLAERIGLPAEQIASEVNGRCDFVIANSHFTQTQQGKPGRSFVLYNTADAAAFDLPLRAREDRLRVGMLSSNLPKKGLEDFFRIARRAEERGDPLEFWLIGPENKWVEEHFQSNGARPANVHCPGYVEEPPDILREIDVVINLSTFAESFGRSVAEGMLARRPAVVYEYGALPELIRDGVDGFVVPFRDTEGALDRLNRLAQDRSLLEQMAKSARARAVANFSRSVGAEALNRIYDTILQSGSSARVQPPIVVPAARKIRIGYFMWHFPVPSETFVLNELRDFVRLGHDVLVFCKESPHKEFEPDFPIEWQRVKSPEELAAKMQENGREIMHSHFVYPTVTQFLWPACELAGVPFTFIAHAVDIFRHENAEKNRIGEVACSSFCRRVFAPGTFHRDFFIANGVPDEKIIINPQGILFDAYEAQPIAARLAQPKMSVCAIHRFIEKKGLEHAIRSARVLAPLGISLHLYGYGPLEQSYRDLVAELGLDNVFFPGPIKDRNHMIAAFREHDLFLCPSLRAADGDMDGIPTILIEAMASHVPVVASRVSSIPDLVIDGVTGYLCEPNDVDSLTRAILRFYREPRARVQATIENAREHVRKRFDVAKSNRTLLRTWAGEGVDIVLVTFNATAEVREVIERIYRYTRAPFQLFIVDNGSEQETLDYLRSVEAGHDNARLLPQSENLFVGPGTNKGIEAGRAPVAVYLCSREGYLLAEGWDQDILNYIEDHPHVGLAGTLGYSPSYFTGADYIEQLEPFSRFRNPEFAAKNRDRVFRHVQGGMFAIRRAMYESIGGFSEAVPHNHTDVEYSYYVESCGWQLGAIPDFVILYQKSRPVVTSRLTEFVRAVHPGSLILAPLLDSVVTRQTNLCNVCGNPISFPDNLICPVCASTPYQRSLYRFLADSTLTYRQLVALHIGESDGLLPDWKKMFSGRALTYADSLSELNEKGRIDHPAGRFDLVVLRLPDAVSDAPGSLLSEVMRVLKPHGHLLFFQLYGGEAILDSAAKGPSNPEQIVAMIESQRFQVESRARYASAAVRYSEHEIFVCRKPLPE